jgi:L-amino acid N-acyltransferase YncA
MTRIRLVNAADAKAVCDIYNYYVSNSTISFEEAEVSVSEMSRRIVSVSETLPWVVIETDGIVDGYAYATKWRERSAYRFSVELSVYVAPSAIGQGCGTLLYENLFERLTQLGVHLLIAGIALPNENSIKLHEKMGFIKVAHFAEVGFKNNQWVDVAYWQRFL